MSATCCPKGYNFIDSAGNFNDPYFGYGSITNALVGDFVNKCAILVNVGTGPSPITAFALPDPIEPIECPCCPVNYSYSDYIALCVKNGNRSDVLDPVPCIQCVCPPAPEPVPCPPCGSDGEPINFSFNFNSRECQSCTPQNGNVPCGAITSFLAGPLQDPIYTNFKLKNKNFI